MMLLLYVQICDRYAYSGVAFTSSKGLDLDWCKACDRGLPAPDCVIYLDIPVEDAALVCTVCNSSKSFSLIFTPAFIAFYLERKFR